MSPTPSPTRLVLRVPSILAATMLLSWTPALAQTQRVKPPSVVGTPEVARTMTGADVPLVYCLEHLFRQRALLNPSSMLVRRMEALTELGPQWQSGVAGLQVRWEAKQLEVKRAFEARWPDASAAQQNPEIFGGDSEETRRQLFLWLAAELDLLLVENAVAAHEARSFGGFVRETCHTIKIHSTESGWSDSTKAFHEEIEDLLWRIQ